MGRDSLNQAKVTRRYYTDDVTGEKKFVFLFDGKSLFKYLLDKPS